MSATLGTCGCTDYHMADCPLLTDRYGSGGYEPEDDGGYYMDADEVGPEDDDRDDDPERVTVSRVVADQGSVVLFAGVTEDGRTIMFAVDHRPAQTLAYALGLGEQPLALVEPWQIMGGVW